MPGSQTIPGAGPETVAYITAYLSPGFSCGKRASIALAPRVSTGRNSLRLDQVGNAAAGVADQVGDVLDTHPRAR